MQANARTGMKSAGLVQCSICMLFFGGFFVLVGIILTSVGHSFADDSFFYDAHRPMRIIGPIMLSFGIVFVITGICIIYHAKKEMKEAFNRGEFRTGVSGPIISGSGPPNTYMGTQAPATQPMIHPTTNVGYTPQYGGATTMQPSYPPTEPNQPPASQPMYPAASYPAPTAGYPPTNPPPQAATNPGYPPPTNPQSAPTAPYPTGETYPTKDAAPPPSYEEVAGKN